MREQAEVETGISVQIDSDPVVGKVRPQMPGVSGWLVWIRMVAPCLVRAASVRTDQSDGSRRSRSSQVVVIDEAGQVMAAPVDWTVEKFDGLRDAADCEHADGRKFLRCGAPFEDLSEALSTWFDTWVPKTVRAFLARYSRCSR